MHEERVGLVGLVEMSEKLKWEVDDIAFGM
jgi:hypothetical protein